MGNNSFSFETLDAYRVARLAACEVARHRDELVGLPGDVRSQIHRAMQSVLLNIAEGTGRATKKDQCRHYVIARGSVAEVAAAVDVATVVYGAIPVQAAQQLMSLLRRTGQLLSGLIRASQRDG